MQTAPLKLVVTGANGFVGRSLCRRLIQSKYTVVAAVRHSILNVPEPCSYVEIGEINDHTDWLPAIENCDVVIHLAARVHVMNDKTSESLVEFLKVNLHGTLNLARQAAAVGVRRFVYVSTIKVNGEYTDGKPFTELDTANPQDPYAVSKWQAELGLHEISRDTGMELVIVRPPLVYGAGVKANFYQLLKLVYASLPLPFGSINNRRSMVYVDNLVDALVLCVKHPKAVGQTYLLSDGEAVSTVTLVEMLASAMKKQSRVLPFPIQALRMLAQLIGKGSAVERLIQSLEVDNSRISQDLGWLPPYSLEHGLKLTADWFINSRIKVSDDS